MVILILGGTRFLGKRVAKNLTAAGHELTLLSRRSGDAPAGVRQISAERASGLDALRGSHFDLVLDFICYDSEDLDPLISNIIAERYVLISSTWVPRLWSGSRADELVIGEEPVSAELPTVTIDYLSGKLGAEHALVKLRQTGCAAVSLRLPIMLGEDDHTGRLNFYRSRLADGGPLIIVDEGQNLAQIAVMEDTAHAVVRWSTTVDISRFLVWEALPDEGRSVRMILETMAAAVGREAMLVDVPLAELTRYLPAYLEQEPFWRESALPVTAANIYSALGMTPAVFGQDVDALPLAEVPVAGLRSEELKFLISRHDD